MGEKIKLKKYRKRVLTYGYYPCYSIDTAKEHTEASKRLGRKETLWKTR